MKINSSNVGMESARNYSSKSKEAYQNTLISTGFGGFQIKDSNSGKKLSLKTDSQKDPVTITTNTGDLRQRFEAMRSGKSTYITSSRENNMISEIKSRCIDFLLYLILGEKYSKYNYSTNSSFAFSGSLNPDSGKIYQVNQAERYYEENETTTFSTTGTVLTADGRSIEFDVTAEMSRSFMQYAEITELKELPLYDPLVINLDGNVADVSDQTFYFDIDSDGIEDKISKLISGSGFLAYDKNEDGIINDGNELFGTKSGNGFADLLAYDDDSNGWIDEDDDIFSKLKIFSIDDKGRQHLVTLKEAGVGAICLQSQRTDFSIKDLESNQTKAQVRRSGVFLFEDGHAGTVQQVDMAVM